MKKKINLSVDLPNENPINEIILGKKNDNKNLEETEDDCDCSCYCGSDVSFPNSSQETIREKSNSENSETHGKKERREFAKPASLIIIGLALTIALVTLELMEFYGIIENRVAIDYLLLILATPVQILLGGPFYKRFYNSLKRRKGFTVDTLVVLSTSVAYGYSIVALLTNQDIRFFEASSSVLTIFTIGEYIENKILRTTSESIRKLFALKPKTALVIREDGREETINVVNLKVNDVFIVKPGENISADGVVVLGQTSLDESMITGESIPVEKSLSDKVIGGTVNKNGNIHVKATGVGNQTVLASIIEMVTKARTNKPSIQRIADRCAKYFVPVVFSIAIISSLYWLIVVQAPIQFVITVFATILVVSCPCALGIATPMVVSLAIGMAAKEGIIVKGGKYLEKLSSVDTIVFDKTGTLTWGKPEVTDIIPNSDYDEFYLLQIAASSEIKSEHPIAHAIVTRAKEKGIPLLNISEFSAIAGHGIVAKYNQARISVVSPNIRNELPSSKKDDVSIPQNKIPSEIGSRIQELESEGKTVVAVFLDTKLVGIIAVSDTIRENVISVVNQIKAMGKEVILLSGDNPRAANAIARKVGIKNVYSQMLPSQKMEKIMSLQKENHIVAMVGDGINDAPALTQADVGIAIGSGTDVAKEAGHIILIKNNLDDIVFILRLSRYSIRKIKQNLAISFAYNSITIPLAAGLLYGVTNSLLLTPALAALGWIISDSLVFGNSLMLRRFKKLI